MKLTRPLLILVVGLLAGGWLAAQEAADDPFGLIVEATHRLEVSAPVDPAALDFAGPLKAPRLTNFVDLTAGTSRVKAVSRWKLETFPILPGSLDVARSTDSVRVTPGENAVYWSPDLFKFGFGWQTWAWGSADGKNPTDVLNPRDYNQGLTADKLPALAATAVWYPADAFTLEAVVQPYTGRDRFPVDFAASIPDALFWGRDTDGVNLTVQTGAGFQRSVQERLLPLDFSALTAGTRARLKLAGWDLALSYVYGLDSYLTPRLTLAVDPILLGGTVPTGLNFWRVADLSLERLRLHRFGLDAKTTVGDIGLWAETGLDLTENPTADSYAVRHPKLSWTTGLDTSFGENAQYYLNLQYFGEYIFGYDAQASTNYPGGKPSQAQIGDRAAMEQFYYRSLTQSLGAQTQGLLQGLLFDLKLPYADNFLTIDLKGAVMVPQQFDQTLGNRLLSTGLNPELDLMPVDSFHLKLGASLAYTWVRQADDSLALKTAGDPVGQFTPDNRIYFQAVYKWVTK